MDNKTYWSAKMMWQQMNKAEITATEIAMIYQKAGLYVNREIKGIFEKYQTKHNLTKEEAIKLISELRNKTDIEELKNKLAENPKNKELIAELESPAYASRIDRLVRLSNNIDYLMKSVCKQEEALDTALFKDIAESSYYRGIYEVQSCSGYGFDFSHLNKKQVDKALEMRWSGTHFSKRIWKNTDAVAEKVKTDMLVNLITGRTEWETAKDMMKDFSKGANIARRLVRTESCYVSSEMIAQGYEQCDVERYRFVSVLDMRTSNVCRRLDGKTFPLSQRMPGINYPPMHPWCRSTTIAELDKEILHTLKRRATLPDGTVMTVPADMTYKEWYEKYVEGKKWKPKVFPERNLDKLQYDRYKTVLGDNAPESFEKFHDLKYNDSESWKHLKLKYKDEKLRHRIKETYNLKIRQGLQDKHIKGTPNYNQEVAKGNCISYLLDGINPQELVNEYAGTGEFIRDLKDNWTNKEKIILPFDIGYVYDYENSEYKITNRMFIHYSKNKGTHIVPRKRRWNYDQY